MRSFLIAIALAALPISAHAHEPEETPRCYDVAVVARLIRETPEPFPDLGPDVIVIRWPWILEFETEEVVIGRVDHQRMRVTASMHTNFNRQIDHFLLFLRRYPDGRYVAEDIVVNVVRDRRGRFIIPLEAPIASEELSPEGWLPASYESYLRPVRYRSRDAWWLSEQYLDDDYLAETPPGWHIRRDGRVVALRGLYLSDLPTMMAQEASATCAR